MCTGGDQSRQMSSLDFLTTDQHAQFSREPESLSAFPVNWPNATAIAMKCDELKHLSVTMGETASDSKAALDFEVIAGSSALRTVSSLGIIFSRGALAK